MTKQFGGGRYYRVVVDEKESIQGSKKTRRGLRGTFIAEATMKLKAIFIFEVAGEVAKRGGLRPPEED